MMQLIVLILSATAVVYCGSVPEDTLVRSLIGKFVDCVNSDLNLCVKENALKAAEKLRTVHNFTFFDGITLLNNDPGETRSMQPLSADPNVRNIQVSDRLRKSTSDLLRTSELEFTFPGVDEEGEDDDDEEEETSDYGEEGRGKKKKKKKKKKEEIKKKLKILVPLLLFIQVKAVVLVIFSIVVTALSVYKIALLAKIAFIMKIFSHIKSHFTKKNEKEDNFEVEHTWEPPMNDEHSNDSGGGWPWPGTWSRLLKKGQKLLTAPPS